MLHPEIRGVDESTTMCWHRRNVASADRVYSKRIYLSESQKFSRSEQFVLRNFQVGKFELGSSMNLILYANDTPIQSSSSIVKGFQSTICRIQRYILSN